MKHTQGPWENVGNMVVAKLQTVDGTFIYPTMAVLSNTTTSMKSNASLITAAPEMLAVLEGLYIEMLGQGPHADAVSLRVVESVIKKAKGV